MKIVAAAVFCAIIMIPAKAASEVLVYDMVAPMGREAMLRAETQEGFFRKGGVLVEFFVDGISIGKGLSGGDGMAYRRYVPANVGQHKMRVTSGGDQDEGVLLAVKRSAQLVLVDVEGSLTDSFIAVRPRSGGLAAVNKIRKKYPIVFLQTSIVGLRVAKLWLKENGFPPAPVLPWNGGQAFREMREKNLTIKAVVGGADVVKSAKEYRSLTFSFAPGDEEAVQDWDEVVKRIR